MSEFTHDSQAPLLQEPREAVTIPTFAEITAQYSMKWQEEKEKFHMQLHENFRTLVSQWKSGKQEIFELNESKLGTYIIYYERAFRELFQDTGYEAHVGPTERVGSGTNKVKKLYITLPDCFGQ